MDDELIFRVLIGQADPAERARVLAWKESSSENARRYQEIARVLYLVSLADEGSSAERNGSVPSGHLGAGRRARERAARVLIREARRRRWLAWSGGIAAAVAFVIAAGAFVFWSTARPFANGTSSSDSHEFVTGPNETANVVLQDGTVIRLAEDTRLRVPNGSRDRGVSISGRAYFAVAKDESRPFTIRTTGGDVRVLGTRFMLEASGDDLRLVVIEGRVSVVAGRNEVMVGPSQMARVIDGRALPVITVPDPRAFADWMGDFLAFQDTPLSDVVGEIERHFGVDIVLADRELAGHTLTAWFAGHSLAEVMEVVCIVTDADCQVGESEILMRVKR